MAQLWFVLFDPGPLNPRTVLVYIQFGNITLLALALLMIFEKTFFMKNIYHGVLTLIAVMFVLESFGQSALEIHVNNIKSNKGAIQFGLFTNETDYLKTPKEKKTVKSTGTDVTIVFENLPPGEYALSVIHDENENGKLDSNAFGIPKEGFAFGNNAQGSFGPPSFEKAKITIADQNIKQEITLKYY